MGRAPSIMHYGSDYHLGRAYFNKMAHQNLKLESCPGFLFEDPGLPSLAQLDKKDALSMEHLATMNAAFCEFYTRLGCTHMPARCGAGGAMSVKAFTDVIAELQPVLRKCADDHDGCGGWKDAGECQKNPLFMHAHCAVACGSCDKKPDDLDFNAEEKLMGDWRHEEEVRSGEQLKHALEFVRGLAQESALQKLDEAIAERRETLAAKHEL